MYFVLVGVSYKTAAVEIRDALAFSKEEAQAALAQLRVHDEISECLILSTCNRTEILAVMNNDSISADGLVEFFAKAKNFDIAALKKHVYVQYREAAVEHLFSVCSGLDSMALGETQIVSQIKDAYELCCSQNCNGPYLNRLMNRALGVSKRIRSSTSIGQGSLSVSFVACDLAKRALGEIAGRDAILVGAGEMGQLTARHLRKRGVGHIRITSRNLERAQKLAEHFDGEAFPLAELPERMAETDVVVTATSADDYVITGDMVDRALAGRNHALVLIDLGVPRDIEPSITEKPGVELYNIDHLESLVAANREQRQAELNRCYDIVREEAQEFIGWAKSYMASPVIAELQSHFEQIRSSEIRSLRNQLSHHDFNAVDEATRSLIQKILRHPIVHLVEAAKQEDPVPNMKSVCCILGLHELG